MAETTDLQLPETMHIEPVATPSDDQPTPESRPASPREEAMARIAERRMEVFRAELDYGETMADEARAAAGRAPLEPESEGEAEATPDALPDAVGRSDATTSPGTAAVEPRPPAAPTEAPRTYDFDLGNGQRAQVTQEQLHQLARMGVAANQAMRMAPMPAPAPASAAPAPSAVAAPIPLLSDDAARSYHRRIAYGDDADGAAAIRELVTDVATHLVGPPQYDPRVLVNVARDQALQQIRLESNLTAIGQEYPDIFSDRSLSQFAAFKLTEVRNEDAALGTARTDLDAYREACSRVRGMRGAPPPSATPQPQPGDQQRPTAAPQAALDPNRTERKRAAPRVPASVSRAASQAASPRELTGAEIVDRMRRQRGQYAMH